MNDLNRQFLILFFYYSLTVAIGTYLISASQVTNMQFLLCCLGFAFLRPFCLFIIEVTKDVISLVRESFDNRRK